MQQPPFELNHLNEVLNKTIHAIEDGKKEIYEISEKARSDFKGLEIQLKEVKERIATLISDVDILEIKEKLSRQRLLEVSKNFRDFNEADIKKAYETAKDLQIELSLKRKEENDLFKLRTEIEMRLKDSREVARHAEILTSKVGLALQYLSEAANDKLDDIRQKSEMGIRIIKAQEEERHRVSREIHDGPAQAMANVMIKAEYCERLIDVEPQKAKGEIRLLKEIVKDSLKNIRRIIYDLLPMSLDDLGLKPTIIKLVEDFKKETGIDTRLIYLEHQPIKLKRVLNLTVFRIVQEGLNNVRKHAEATVAIVELVIAPDQVEVKVHDNGLGFDLSLAREQNVNTESGYGIFAMRERVELLDGSFTIESQVHKGTKLIIAIPLKNEVLMYE